MLESAALPLLLILAATGAVVVPALAGRDSSLPRALTMAIMLAILFLSTAIFLAYDGTAGSRSFAFSYPWMPSLGVNLHFGVDGLNVYLLLLCAVLFPVVLGCAWTTAEAQSRLYLALMLALEAGLLGTFLAQNLMLFFVFWEAVLIPMAVLILVFGGERRRQAAVTFFLYTMAGSVLLLAAVIQLGVENLQQTGSWSFEFESLYRLHLDWGTQLFVFFAITLACAIKCPLFPFHSWLPLAYGEAPASGTALMAGLLSKMGAFGLLKLAVPLCPDVALYMAPYLVLLAVVSILYGAVLALRQPDYKRLVAFSSLSHMGYIVLGIFSFQQTSIHGSLFQILSHGLAVAGLFLLLGMLEQRSGAAYRQSSALAARAPRLAVVMLLFVLTSVALPLTSGFTAEFLVLFGAFQQGFAAWQSGAGTLRLAAVLFASTAMVLGAAYMLRFARVILYGKSAGGPAIPDLGLREGFAFTPLLLLILWVGVWPYPLMTKVQSAVSQLAGTTAHARPPLSGAAPAVAVVGRAHGD
jgi:NADH-quinone oxidoreductase subunit M